MQNLKEELKKPLMIRLSPYGTIEASYSESLLDNYLGQPIMRFIHPDDLQTFCAGLSEAIQHHRMAHFRSIRLVHDHQTIYTSMSVMVLERHQTLVVIESSLEHQVWSSIDQGLAWLIRYLVEHWVAAVIRPELVSLVKAKKELVCEWMGYWGVSQQTSGIWLDYTLSRLA